METIEEKLYDFPAGHYCGVLMPKHVMVRVAKLQAKYVRELREVLTENYAALYASNWTIANEVGENGEIKRQITIRYVDGDSILSNRIALFGPVRPKAVDCVYIVKDYNHAKEVAEAVLAAGSDQ